MSIVLDQCMEILNLTSLAWKGRERYSVVAHSFRVMAKAKNYDEMVVGMMHELYAASSYTRLLFHSDVNGDPQWVMSLDLLTPPLKKIRIPKNEEITDNALLEANLPRFVSEKHREQWFLRETRWTQTYYEWIRKISQDRIARNVMIYDLTDKLEILLDPTKYVDELGPQWFVLPWKKHYCVSYLRGKCRASKDVPRTDDELLLREITEDERYNLIEKYTLALDHLRWVEDCHPTEREYSREEQLQHANIFNQWFHDWVAHQEELEMYMEDCGDGIQFGNDGPSC